MFDWLRNYFARNSPEFKKQVREIEDQRRKIEMLETADLITIVTYEEKLNETTRERDEANVELETVRDELNYAGMKISRLRQTKHALERETSELKERIALSIPITAVGNMLKSSQYAGFFVNSDDMILFSNEHANAYFGKTLEGRSLVEVIPIESMDQLKERLDNERIGFKLKARGPLYGWQVAIAKDSGGFYGYALSNERGFVEKLKDLFLSAKEAREYTTSENGVLVPQTSPIIPR